MLQDGALFSGENADELMNMVRHHEHLFTRKILYLLLERLKEQERLINDLRSRVVQNGVFDVTDEEREDSLIRKAEMLEEGHTVKCITASPAVRVC